MKTLTVSLIAGSLLALAPACSETPEEEEPVVADETQEINSFILHLPDLPIADYQPKMEVPCGDDCVPEQQEEELLCNYARYTETGHYSQFIAFQPNSASLWPGSIVQGKDAQNGFFTPVGVERAPITFSVSLENIAGSPVGFMKNPSLSAFREERNNILARGVTGATPAAIDFEVTQVHSSSQVSIALGASVLWPGGANITAGFNFNSSEKKTKILVNYTQAYYTIDIDTPIEPSDFFGENVTLEELSAFMDTDNPPLSVQSITYGRRVIFTVESNETADKIKAALEAAYEASVDVDAKLDVEYERALEESTIRAFVLGGSGAEAAGAISGFEGLIQYISKGGDYSKDSPGAPIAYKLAYLDNAVTKFAFTTEYTERQCVQNRSNMHVELAGIDHLGGDDSGDTIELYGYISIRYPTPDNPVVDCQTGGEVADLMDLDEGQWLTMDKFTSWSPTSATYLDLNRVPIGLDESVCIFAEFWEHDGIFGDDYFGYHERLVSFETGWAGDHVLQPRGDGEAAVDVRLRISVD